jgi:hypothetical protein
MHSGNWQHGWMPRRDSDHAPSPSIAVQGIATGQETPGMLGGVACVVVAPLLPVWDRLQQHLHRLGG